MGRLEEGYGTDFTKFAKSFSASSSGICENPNQVFLELHAFGLRHSMTRFDQEVVPCHLWFAWMGQVDNVELEVELPELPRRSVNRPLRVVEGESDHEKRTRHIEGCEELLTRCGDRHFLHRETFGNRV